MQPQLTPGSLELQQAQVARQEERYADALQQYQASAAANNPQAVWELSILYEDQEWGLINADRLINQHLLLQAAELGYEPAMVDYMLQYYDTAGQVRSPYYARLMESKNPYVIARLADAALRALDPIGEDDITLTLALYQKAAAAGYHRVWFYIQRIAHPQAYPEYFDLLKQGAAAGSSLLQVLVGKVYDSRVKIIVGYVNENDHDAMFWYLKAVKQLSQPAISQACTIYFDESSPCYDALRGAEICVLSISTYAKSGEGEINTITARAYCNKLIIRLISNKLKAITAEEQWIYGRLFCTANPRIQQLEIYVRNMTDYATVDRCIRIYRKTVRAAQDASLTFILCWKQSPAMWALNRDVVRIIAKSVYASRSQASLWLRGTQ